MMNNPFKCFDASASINPGRSMGGVSIGTHIKAIYPLLSNDVCFEGLKISAWNRFYIRYQFSNIFIITVHILNGRIIELIALNDYLGQIPNGIKTGMSIGAAIDIEPRVYFDEQWECYYIHYVPGINLKCDNNPRLASSKITAIEIYYPEWENWSEEKARGEWQ